MIIIILITTAGGPGVAREIKKSNFEQKNRFKYFNFFAPISPKNSKRVLFKKVSPFGPAVWSDMATIYIQINIYERRALSYSLAWEPIAAQVTKFTPAVHLFHHQPFDQP